jgi:hypothetical protein
LFEVPYRVQLIRWVIQKYSRCLVRICGEIIQFLLLRILILDHLYNLMLRLLVHANFLKEGFLCRKCDQIMSNHDVFLDCLLCLPVAIVADPEDGAQSEDSDTG